MSKIRQIEGIGSGANNVYDIDNRYISIDSTTTVLTEAQLGILQASDKNFILYNSDTIYRLAQKSSNSLTYENFYTGVSGTNPVTKNIVVQISTRQVSFYSKTLPNKTELFRVINVTIPGTTPSLSSYWVPGSNQSAITYGQDSITIATSSSYTPFAKCECTTISFNCDFEVSQDLLTNGSGILCKSSAASFESGSFSDLVNCHVDSSNRLIADSTTGSFSINANLGSGRSLQFYGGKNNASNASVIHFNTLTIDDTVIIVGNTSISDPEDVLAINQGRAILKTTLSGSEYYFYYMRSTLLSARIFVSAERPDEGEWCRTHSIELTPNNGNITTTTSYSPAWVTKEFMAVWVPMSTDIGKVLTATDEHEIDWLAPSATATTCTLETTMTLAGEDVTVQGVKANNIVVVTPAPASAAVWEAAGVKCTAQAANTLTFTATSAPSADITVNVAIFN